MNQRLKFWARCAIGTLMGVWVLAVLGIAIAGTNTLPLESAGVIQRTHINKFQIALAGDYVPRNTSGVATTIAGSLGSSTYYWLKAFIKSGYWSVGDIKMHHSYNGAAGPGHGWMLCDGDVINETNYDAEHGAGTWDTYVGSSPLDGKYLPNMTGRYPVGAATTTQNGSVAITGVGNTSHQVNLQHTHTIANHNHQWLENDPGGGGFWTFGSDGLAEQISTTGSGARTILYDTNASSETSWDEDAYTNNTSLTPANSLSTTQSIQPESIEVQYYMRIIE